MRIVLLVLLLVLPSLAQTKGFESWPSPLFVLVVWVEERPDNVNPYVWIYNPTASVLELDENSFSMTDTAGDGMERSTSQAAGTYVSLGSRRGWNSLCGGGPGRVDLAGAVRPVGTAVAGGGEGALKSHWGEALLESGGLPQAPKV